MEKIMKAIKIKKTKNNKNKSKNNDNAPTRPFLEEAKQNFYNEGISNFNEKDYNEAHQNFIQSLAMNESLDGRYQRNNAGIYGAIASAFYKQNDLDNAFIAYRTNIRIRRFLSKDINRPRLNESSLYDMKNPSIMFKEKGLSTGEIKIWNKNMKDSIRYEQKGDSYRTKGKYDKAIKKYKKSMKREKICVGNTICLAYLQRKIALISTWKNNNNGPSLAIDPSRIDWTKIDRIGAQTNRHYLLLNINDDIHQLIKDGDGFNADYNALKAFKCYKKATKQAKKLSVTSPPSSTANVSLSSPSSSSSVDDGEDELKNTLLETITSVNDLLRNQNEKISRLEQTIDEMRRSSNATTSNREKKARSIDLVQEGGREQDHPSKRRRVLIDDSNGSPTQEQEEKEGSSSSSLGVEDDNKKEIIGMNSWLSSLEQMNIKLLQNQASLIETVSQKSQVSSQKRDPNDEEKSSIYTLLETMNKRLETLSSSLPQATNNATAANDATASFDESNNGNSEKNEIVQLEEDEGEQLKSRNQKENKINNNSNDDDDDDDSDDDDDKTLAELCFIERKEHHQYSNAIDADLINS